MFDIVDKIHVLCTMSKTECNNVSIAVRHLYNPSMKLSGFRHLLGFLHTSFRMVNWESDFIDFIQKDIEQTTPKTRKSKQRSTHQRLSQAMNYIVCGNTAGSQ